MDTTTVPELLAPGGSPTKAMTALQFGADAVYIGGEAFGLRANAENFTPDQIRELTTFANRNRKKVYVTLNILPRTDEIPQMCAYAKVLQACGVHGAIVSDLGAFAALRQAVPALPLHISTQANTLNAQTCRFWHEQGAVRVNLARELTLREIREIAAEKTGAELEVFVHGAMCMAYSGRCLLSDYMTGRSSNRGDCAQPCRWNYRLHEAAVTEDGHPGQRFPVEETDRGTFLFNSRDLCLLEYLPQLLEAGVSALKIEGRMKSDFYVAVVVRAYRIALDALARGVTEHEWRALVPSLVREVCSVSHREYSTGFLLGEKGSQVYTSSSYIRNSDFVGIVTDCRPLPGTQAEARAGTRAGAQAVARAGAPLPAYELTVSQRGNFGIGDTVEFVAPDPTIRTLTVTSMQNADREPITRAPHPVMQVYLPAPFPVSAGAMVRRVGRAEGAESGEL